MLASTSPHAALAQTSRWSHWLQHCKWSQRSHGVWGLRYILSYTLEVRMSATSNACPSQKSSKETHRAEQESQENWTNRKLRDSMIVLHVSLEASFILPLPLQAVLKINSCISNIWQTIGHAVDIQQTATTAFILLCFLFRTYPPLYTAYLMGLYKLGFWFHFNYTFGHNWREKKTQSVSVLPNTLKTKKKKAA